MKKILWMLLWVFILTACSGEDDTPEKPLQRVEGRTILTFLWANNNLMDDLQTNVFDLMYGLTEMDEPATVVVFWDGKGSHACWPTPTIVTYHTDGKGKVNGHTRAQLDALMRQPGHSQADVVALGKVQKVYPDQISTEPQVVRQVLTDMMKAVPSHSYGLIFGSHGSGWLPSIFGGRSIGQDGDFTNHTIQIPQLATALQAALQSVGQQQFDFLLFDACMMGSAEVCYELKEATRYCVASVLDIPASGFPYREILADMFAADLRSSLSHACSTYVEVHNGESWGTISLVDCSRMDALATAIRDLLETHQDRMSRVPLQLLQEYGRERMGNDSFVGIHCDMVQYLEELVGGELPASFKEVFRDAVPYADYTPMLGHGCHYYKIDGAHYCGLGMYIPYYPVSPADKAEFWNGYFLSSISWSQAAGWVDTSASWAF